MNITTPNTPQTGNRRELIAFRIADQEFCVDIMAVREIRGWTQATPLPQAPSYVRGVINLRGAVLPIVDLAARLREPGRKHQGMLESELAAAVAGGVSSVVCPPDTDPVLDEPGLVEMLKIRAEKPQLILMDVVMPGQNGFQATRAIARNPLTEHLPVIICTSKAQETDRIWGMRQGARDYIVNGRMIGGFGAIAWPVRYGVTGVMTFIVDYKGEVYQQDLGPETAQKAGMINIFNPDKGWVKADMTPP